MGVFSCGDVDISIDSSTGTGIDSIIAILCGVVILGGMVIILALRSATAACPSGVPIEAWTTVDIDKYTS